MPIKRCNAGMSSMVASLMFIESVGIGYANDSNVTTPPSAVAKY